MAERLGVSKTTIHNALEPPEKTLKSQDPAVMEQMVNDAQILRDWREQHRQKKKSVHTTASIEDALAHGREPASNNAQAAILSDDEVDNELQRLIQQDTCTPEHRAKLNSLDKEAKRRLAAELKSGRYENDMNTELVGED